MLRIALCDDESLELHQLELQVERYRNLHPELAVSYNSFQTPATLLAHVYKGAFHIYLLDIIMNEKNGIEIGSEIRKTDEEAIIIYTTVSPDYALDAFNVTAFHYLVKPVEDQRLFTVLDSAVRRHPIKPDGYLKIRTANETFSVLKNAVVYVEYYSHCLSYHLENGSVITGLSFRESFDRAAAPLLENILFQKVSSSHIVNLAQVERITKRGFLMKNGAEVNVTRLYSIAKKNYSIYILRGGGGK